MDYKYSYSEILSLITQCKKEGLISDDERKTMKECIITKEPESAGEDISVNPLITFKVSTNFLKSWSFWYSSKSTLKSGSFVIIHSFIVFLSSSDIKPSFLHWVINDNISL